MQLTEAEAKALEELENNPPLKNGLGRSYINNDGTKCRNSPTSGNYEPEDGPIYLSVDERIRRIHGITLPLTKPESKSATSNIDLPPCPSIRNLG